MPKTKRLKPASVPHPLGPVVRHRELRLLLQAAANDIEDLKGRVTALESQLAAMQAPPTTLWVPGSV